MPHDVFISYSSKDKTIADAICAKVESKGIRCWMAPRDIIPGSEWSASIIDAIHGCRAMVIVFSSHADASQQVKREAERAVSKGVAILPFRIEDVYPSGSMEYYLSTSHWLDAISAPLEAHLQHLAETIRLILSGAAPTENPMPSAGGRPETARYGPAASTVGAALAADRKANDVAARAQEVLQDKTVAPEKAAGFNWGAFLLNRSWLGWHNTRPGCWFSLPALAPYLAIVIGLIFGFNNQIVWLLGAGVLIWLLYGLKGNAWALHNRRWINDNHFKTVQRNWLLRGIGFWVVVAVLGTVFVQSGLNRTVRATTLSLAGKVQSNPKVAPLLHQTKQRLRPVEKKSGAKKSSR